MRTYEADEVDAMLARAVAAEREACAQIVEAERIGFKDEDEQLNRIAAAIRALGQASAQER